MRVVIYNFFTLCVSQPTQSNFYLSVAPIALVSFVWSLTQRCKNYILQPALTKKLKLECYNFTSSGYTFIKNRMEVLLMNLERMYTVLNNDEKFDIYYDERPVWVQGINENEQMAKVGFVDNFEEKDVFIKDLYERTL